MTGHSRRDDDARARLDHLIDFQEAHAPGTTAPLHVALSPTALGKILGKLPKKGGVEFTYRNRVVIATAADSVAARFKGGS